MRIVLKYCGSCNPEVDLAQIGSLITKLVQRQGWQLVALGEDVDILVMLCGCSRTCIDREELTSNASRVVLVAGKRLGWQPVKEKDLPSAVIEAISLAPGSTNLVKLPSFVAITVVVVPSISVI